MAIPKDMKERAKMTREDGVFALKLGEGVSLAMLVEFAQEPSARQSGLIWR
jgi:hypothetical protein